jgi:hypothetical protein
LQEGDIIQSIDGLQMTIRIFGKDCEANQSDIIKPNYLRKGTTYYSVTLKGDELQKLQTNLNESLVHTQ